MVSASTAAHRSTAIACAALSPAHGLNGTPSAGSGSAATTATANFDPARPLYRHIATLSEIRRKTPALMRGATKVRAFAEKPGLLAVSRFDPDTGREVLLAFNTSAAPLSANIAIDMKSAGFTALHGDCPASPAAPGSLHLSLPAFGTIICQAS